MVIDEEKKVEIQRSLSALVSSVRLLFFTQENACPTCKQQRALKEAHATSQCTVSSVLVVRYLERIADHAAYIAEAVVYVATGQKLTLR